MDPRSVPARPPDPGEEPQVAANDTPTDADWAHLGSTRVLPTLEEAAAPTTTEAATEASASNIGREESILGDYRLVAKLGQGAMGAVYMARQISIDRDVALKVLFPHIANNPQLVERLYREGRVMGQLDHPNIVQAYGIGEFEGWHYVAMEYVDGLSLQKWL